MSVFELSDVENDGAKIRVMGVGGGGGNAVKHMLQHQINGVHFISANTDKQVLDEVDCETISIGGELTKGLGAGADPDVGRKAAEESRDLIAKAIAGADLLFITAGMGGGTGTGAAPVIAEIARDLGVLTVGVVTKPFAFEGRKRMQVAEAGIDALYGNVDSLIIVPNNKLLSILGKDISLLDAFGKANEVLEGAVRGIAELITRPGLINVDFADVRTVMTIMGMAMMGTAEAEGEDRARIASEQAVSSPLLEDVDLSGARGILVNITAGPDMSIGEFQIVGDTVRDLSSDDATIVVGTVIDNSMAQNMRVTVVVTGIESGNHVRGRRDATASVNVRRQRDDMAPNWQKMENQQQQSQPSVPPIASQKSASQFASADSDYLDIPAFLRRKEKTTEEE